MVENPNTIDTRKMWAALDDMTQKAKDYLSYKGIAKDEDINKYSKERTKERIGLAQDIIKYCEGSRRTLRLRIPVRVLGSPF